MRYALMTEPQQGLSYEEILALARTAEESGLEAYFRSDHYGNGSGEPTTDAWATLAGLARDTTTIQLGTLVSPVTFRLPGNLAKVIQTVDEMSGGRVEAGFGAGWNEREHAELGLPFPEIDVRYDMLEEQMEIIHRLWTEPDGWSFEGEHWEVRNAVRHGEIARGGRRHPHIIFGGEGRSRMARLVARYGDEFNLLSAAPEKVPSAYDRIRAACRDERRDPDEIVYSAMTGVLIGETADDVRARVADLMAQGGAPGTQDPEAWLQERRPRWIIGTPEEALDRVRAFDERGVQRIMLQDFLPRDLDHVRLMGRIFGT